MGTVEVWRIFASLGLPGLLLGVIYFLLRSFGFNFAQVPAAWKGGLSLVFMVLFGLLTYILIDRILPAKPGVEGPLKASVTIQAGTYEAVELIGQLGALSGGVVLDPRLEKKISGKKVKLSSSLKDVSLELALNQVFGQLGIKPSYELDKSTVLIREDG
jgi:hypothetical protein